MDAYPSGQHIPSIEELNEYGSYGCLKNQPGGGSSDGYFNIGKSNLLSVRCVQD
ncbi:MAG: hypothetical protein LBH25_04020 [Fibromonadaceae bacterium]|nr:hypothetical protein [Fibromonadaceae bacterium]